MTPSRWALSRAGVVVLAALVVALVAVVAPAVRGADDERLAEIERDFSEHRTAFETAVDRMAGLVADFPDARWIAWTSALVCVADSAGGTQCDDTSSEQRAAFMQLSGPDTVVWQAKDGGRVFFVFDVENPPVHYLMHDPEARDLQAYAEAQGFQWGREVDDRWSVMGHIEDDEQESSMWLG